MLCKHSDYICIVLLWQLNWKAWISDSRQCKFQAGTNLVKKRPAGMGPFLFSLPTLQILNFNVGAWDNHFSQRQTTSVYIALQLMWIPAVHNMKKNTEAFSPAFSFDLDLIFSGLQTYMSNYGRWWLFARVHYTSFQLVKTHSITSQGGVWIHTHKCLHLFQGWEIKYSSK